LLASLADPTPPSPKAGSETRRWGGRRGEKGRIS
jgi:hypothetical protein